MNKLLLTALMIIFAFNFVDAKKLKVIKITVQPKETAIYINNTLVGHGYAEFNRPKKKNEVAIIRCECPEYNTLNTKFYGADERNNLSFALQQDGFYRGSAASGLVNGYITITLDSMYYTIKEGKVDVGQAWKLLHQILLNYFEEIETTDVHGGYLQTPWNYKSFNLSPVLKIESSLSAGMFNISWVMIPSGKVFPPKIKSSPIKSTENL